jgi:hypothetical protein
MKMFDNQFTNVPINPPRRTDFLPGLRFSAVISKSTLYLPLIFVGFFILIPFSIMNSDPSMRLAMGPAKTMQGQVLSSMDTSMCRGTTGRRVTYEFSPEPGHEFRGTTTLCQESPYYSVKEGDEVEVQFVPSDPSVNSIRGGNSNAAPPIAVFLLMPFFILVMFSPMILPQVREVLRARRLFKKGRLALGTVFFVKKRVTSFWPGWPGNSAAEVFIEYESSASKMLEGVAWCPNEWLLQQLPPGAKVHIAYSDESPGGRIALLEAFLR